MAKIESGNLGLSEEDFDLPETVESLMSIMTPQINDKKLNLKVEIGRHSSTSTWWAIPCACSRCS